MDPMSQGNDNQTTQNPNTKTSSPRKSAYRIGLLVLLLGAPIGLICGLFSVVLVWTPFQLHEFECGPAPGTMDSLFAPGFTFGNFTIAQARAIDLSWNLFMGRGLQAIVGFASYRIVTGGLLWMAETVPIPYEIFVSLVFNTNSMITVGTLATSIKSTRGFKIKATLTFFLLSATFILALPTLIDISTGYVQNVEKIRILTNGTRLLKNENTCVWSNMTGPALYFSNEGECSRYKDLGWTKPREECVLSVGYQWGFSRTWILTLSMFFLIWGISVCGVWIDTSRNSHFYRQGIDLGKWKAISDLGKVIQEELSPHTNEEGEMGLQKRISKAAPVKYTIAYDEEEETRVLRHTLSSKLSDWPNASSMDGPSGILPPINITLRLFQLSMAIANITLNSWGFQRFRGYELATLNVYSIVSSFFIVAIALYNILSKIFGAIYFIWVAISLDIVAIATQLHCIITMLLWLRHKDNYFTAFVDTDLYQLTDNSPSRRNVAVAVFAIVGIELILFMNSLAISSMKLHHLHKSGEAFGQ